MITNFDQLFSEALLVKGKRVVVVNPNNEETISAIADACKHSLAEFILVGDESAIGKRLAGADVNVSLVRIVHQPSVEKALQCAVELVRDGGGDILMKGSVDTTTLMKGVLQESMGMKTGRLLSDVFICEYPARKENPFLMITDGGITLAPDLKNKIELIRNAVEVAHALGNTMPKVAMISATEFVSPNLPTTIDAAILAKMSERGQIKGCIVDGPFGLDNAISEEAAAEKGLKSPIAGKAEILVAGNIETANILAKSTTYFAGYRQAHVVIGAKVPILIPSRADKSDAKLLSIALGVLMGKYYAARS